MNVKIIEQLEFELSYFEAAVQQLRYKHQVIRLYFFCDFVNLKSLEYFLRIQLSGIIAITNISGKSESPWKMPQWIFPSAKVCPSVNSRFLFSLAFVMKFMSKSDI